MASSTPLIRLRAPLAPSLAIAVSAVLALAACTIERADVRTPSGEPPEADTTRVRRLVEMYARSFETGELAPLDTVMHDSLSVFEAGRVDRGWVSYRDTHLAPELATLADRRFEVGNVRVRLAGSTAWATFTFSLSASRDGDPVQRAGVATMVFQRLAGRWRLAHIHTSSRPLRNEVEGESDRE